MSTLISSGIVVYPSLNVSPSLAHLFDSICKLHLKYYHTTDILHALSLVNDWIPPLSLSPFLFLYEKQKTAPVTLHLSIVHIHTYNALDIDSCEKRTSKQTSQVFIIICIEVCGIMESLNCSRVSLLQLHKFVRSVY